MDAAKKREDEEADVALFETKAASGIAIHRASSLTILVGIVVIWAYRLVHIPKPGEAGRFAWILIFFAEVLFGLHWIITQSARWCVVYRYPFKDRLSSRYIYNPFMITVCSVCYWGII